MASSWNSVEIATLAVSALTPLIVAGFGYFVGGWKEIEPSQAISVKRQLDETIYANRVLFSDALFTAYHSFMTAMFAMYVTTDADEARPLLDVAP